MSVLTSALNDYFPQDNSQKILTIEVCNSVDHPETFSKITSKEHFKSFLKDCLHNFVKPKKEKVGNKDLLLLSGLNQDMLEQLKDKALSIKYKKELEFFSRFNMFSIMLAE